jgi:hypothetical protein
MNETVAGGLIAIASSTIGAIVSSRLTQQERRWGQARDLITDMSEQVAAYHQVEELLAQRLAVWEKKHAKTIKTEARDVVVEQGYARPWMTDKWVRAHASRWRLTAEKYPVQD